jgi:hypothetical protein
MGDLHLQEEGWIIASLVLVAKILAELQWLDPSLNLTVRDGFSGQAAGVELSKPMLELWDLWEICNIHRLLPWLQIPLENLDL